MEVSAITKQRLPSGKACVSCRKRKNRCDGSRPQCSTCQTRGILCDYPSAPADRFTLEELRALMRAKLGDGAGASDPEAEAPLSTNPLREQPMHTSIASVEAASDMGLFMRAPSDVFGSPSDVGAASSAGATVITVDSSVAARRLSGPGEQTSTASSPSPSESQEPDGYFGESSTFAFVSKVSVVDAESGQRKKKRRLSSVTSARTSSLNAALTPRESSECYEVPPKQLADGLVDAYFAHVHRLYPFCHEPSFRLEYERMWTLQAESRPRIWLGLLNLVFAHGCEFCDSVPSSESVSMAQRFVSNARRIVFAHIFTQGSLELVQALLLMCHYLQSTLELNECWSLVGLMIRTSISLGLHFNPPPSEPLTPVQWEVRKRIWWGCYVVDKTLSMKLGRPPSIQGANTFGTDMPLDVDDQYINQDLIAPRQPEGRPSLTAFFLQTIKLAHLVEKVLLDLYQPNQPRKQGDKLSKQGSVHFPVIGHSILLDGELLSWWNDVPTHLKQDPPFPDGPDFKLQRNVLFIRFLNIRLIIHRQSFLIFSRHDIKDPLQRAVAVASSQTCITAARETIRLIHSQYRRRLLNSLWYNLHYVFTAMGVLLSLQTMERRKREALGESSPDDTLQLGMVFLRSASATSSLAARYVAMLGRIWSAPSDTAATCAAEPSAAQRRGPVNHQGLVDGIGASPFASAHDEGAWLPRPSEDLGMFEDAALVDFSDLLFGTGLPRDLLPTDWSIFSSLH